MMESRSDLWTYRETMNDVDLTGFKVEAVDGSIGKVDEATYDTGASYVVVDTGPWIFGKKIMLPARAVQTVKLEDEQVLVDRTKDEIKGAPEFDPETYRESTYQSRLDDYYGRYYRKSA
jgi:PRC-barrel domain